MEERHFPLDISYLEDTIKYTFKNKDLLLKAVTHSSYVNEHQKHFFECNERLEFLGDSVLSIIVSTYIYAKYSDQMEGILTKIRASVVCEKALAEFAKEIGLGNYLILGHGEEKNDGRNRASVTSDAFEALLGAMYLDSGKNLETVADFLMPFIINALKDTNAAAVFKDYKTELQQIVQQVNGERLEYVVLEESGPDHDKTYTIAAMLNANQIGVGSGRSKRLAEQNAAKEALKLFGISDE